MLVGFALPAIDGDLNAAAWSVTAPAYDMRPDGGLVRPTADADGAHGNKSSKEFAHAAQKVA